ncbi:branched-chain amino acid transaminase [Flavobacterium subsaxonicum]|uniref:Branched-chain-amino-acid aminotransferase n=1 Tax=Flavobacterium subsaxonicum WB 4.1-42 = DSM 21790 TaxID=1121898 RepID=A0A0A2MJ96_9FLAO|nr:branched-chain amino acid transaminase [Flavobacterium subsaxonicum]KGO92374.1 branched-chain amino acid aminotransferase [Flavobacterium subsaxonicum WB 4.1-42 = DSM 21790]
MYFNDNTIIYFNGNFVKAAEANTNLYGQSLHYGYAVFEGIKSYKTENGTKIFKAQEHYDRLRRSAELMHMPFNYTTEELTALSYEVLERNGFSDAYLRPIVICSPNMSLSKGKESYLAIEAWEWSNGYMANKMRITTSSYQRPNPKAFKIEAKVSGHYVNSILACQEAKDAGYDEALVLDGNGFVAESSGANVFYEKDGTLYTPAKGNILPGITRATVLDICKELDIPTQETFFTPDEMRGADAAFFCGTAAEVLALDSLDDVPFTKQWDTTLSATVQKAYQNLVLGKTLEEFKLQLG